MAENEDEIEQVSVREMWPNEALDFTPCLAKNLDLLSDSLGMKMKLVQTETPVGPYYLDILAKETDEGVNVAIENQLEETDLTHLGQLLTYATGCKAKIAVWVAPEFGYEHAQALHRLNKWTREDIRFFGVKVEVFKTTEGEFSPQFRKVVYPGGWNKEITLRSGVMPPTIRQYYDFFQPLITKLRGDGFADKAVQYFDHTGRQFPSDRHAGIAYAVSFWRDKAWVSLDIRLEDNDRTNQAFDALKVYRTRIEESVGAIPNAEWKWHRHDNYGFSTINIARDGSIDDPPKDLAEIRAWMLDLLPKLNAALDPWLKKMLPSK